MVIINCSDEITTNEIAMDGNNKKDTVGIIRQK